MPDIEGRSFTYGMAIRVAMLLTSSLFVVLGIQTLRAKDRAMAARMFGIARGLGLGFIVIKVVEYGAKLSVGLTPITNSFFMYYFAATGLHLFHVIIGLLVLTYVLQNARRPEARPNELRSAEIGATFWHMVDLIWIVLFPLFYLVP